MATLTETLYKKTITYSGSYGDAPFCIVSSGIDTDGGTISGYAIVYNFNTSGIQREKVIQLMEIVQEAHNIMV